MSKYLCFASLILCLGLFACGGDQSTTSKSSEKMEDMGGDKKFQDAHEIPGKVDIEGKGKMVSFSTADGTDGKAYVIRESKGSSKFLFVIHEWWGLNDHIKKEAERLYTELGDVNVMALDLYDGNVATTREDAGKFMKAVKEDRATAIIEGALAYAGEGTKVATIGWCFGGGWSLNSSILAGARGAGCVIYYGMPVDDPAKLVPLEADILGIFADKDEWITPEVVNKFEALTKATGKNFVSHQFDAEHAFANPSSPRYKEDAAQKANALALDFLKSHLK